MAKPRKRKKGKKTTRKRTTKKTASKRGRAKRHGAHKMTGAGYAARARARAVGRAARKNQVPLPILVKRANKLVRLVRKRGGKVSV